MKQILTLYFSWLLCQCNVFGQYEPMAIEGAHWFVQGLGDSQYNSHAMVIKGDSMVNGTLYKKVFRQKLRYQEDGILSPPYFFESEWLFGLLRDDTLEKKVYAIAFEGYDWGLWACEQFEEQLLYDFSLTPGDTLPVCSQADLDFPVVLDSITTETLWGKDRIFQHAENIFEHGIGTIEGIGTELGPFTAEGFFPVPASGIYFVDYCIGTDEECNLLPVNSSSTAPEKFPFKAYPNPATNLLNLEIQFDFQQEFCLTLTNTQGIVVYVDDLSMQTPNTVQINTQGLPIGLYLLSVKTNEWKISKKIAKTF